MTLRSSPLRLASSNGNTLKSSPSSLSSAPASADTSGPLLVLVDRDQWAAWLILLEKAPEQANEIKSLVRTLALAYADS